LRVPTVLRRFGALPLACGLLLVGTLLTGCRGADAEGLDPSLAPRGETMTSVTPTRQDITNRVSLSGTVQMDPVFGVEAPVAGQVRWFDLESTTAVPVRPTTVANVWRRGKAHRVRLPARATFAGRLVAEGSTVAAGMPVVSARYSGYGVVADISGDQAYQIAAALTSVQAQIVNGPGPFRCTVLGTIAALPPGTVPESAPEPEPGAEPTGGPVVIPGPGGETGGEGPGSEPTGMRLVCVAKSKVKFINGAAVTLEITTRTSRNALVLPVEAVAGVQGRGQVDVLGPDGTRQTRDVVLGLTDGRVVEIKSGLEEDETVAVPGPNLPPPVNQPDDGQRIYK
jgi:hypothetical protein